MKQQRLEGLDFATDLAESLAAIRDNAPADGSPYYGLFSGGKDSVVIKHLAKLAGVPVEWHYNVTTIDPPELLKFIKRHHGDVVWDRPKHGNFFNRAAEACGFPTRRNRWCCREYKESTTPAGVVLLMGIRAQESGSRAKRWGIKSKYWKTGGVVINPIFHWEASDLWNFIHSESIPYCSLYDEGFKRLGCIGCPMAGEAGRKKQFTRWPKFEEKWRRVFRRVWERRTGSTHNGRPWFGDAYFDDWQEMFEWWLSDRSLPQKDDDQRSIWRDENDTTQNMG
ncbi:MAG: phosphoadenosine phosphosulfate reductase family protein [Chloroflexi bacterium]|nr:phosphoadenosine phosphosulfate reductase family protein [Chloroflexota bacterium]